MSFLKDVLWFMLVFFKTGSDLQSSEESDSSDSGLPDDPWWLIPTQDLSNLLAEIPVWSLALPISSLMIILNVSDSWGLENDKSFGEGRWRCVEACCEADCRLCGGEGPLKHRVPPFDTCRNILLVSHLTDLSTCTFTRVPLDLEEETALHWGLSWRDAGPQSETRALHSSCWSRELCHRPGAGPHCRHQQTP